MTVTTFIIMGRPGSGKTTQAQKLSVLTGFPIFSSGGRARTLAKHNSYLGRKIADLINHGNLMPAWLASYLFEDTILKLEPEEGIIFEGAARTKEEAERFHEVMHWLQRPYRVFNLEVSESVVRERLAKRATLEGRVDDRLEHIDTRFREYIDHTTHAIEFFRSKNMLVDVDGAKDPEAVSDDIRETLRKL